MTPDAERVLRLLGNASAKQADMAFVLGISVRAVQSALQQLRLAGKPVYSDTDGVRLAQTADEARACSEALRRRLVSQYKTYRALRNTARRMRDEEAAAQRMTLWDSSLLNWGLHILEETEAAAELDAEELHSAAAWNVGGAS